MIENDQILASGHQHYLSLKSVNCVLLMQAFITKQKKNATFLAYSTLHNYHRRISVLRLVFFKMLMLKNVIKSFSKFSKKLAHSFWAWESFFEKSWKYSELETTLFSKLAKKCLLPNKSWL